MMTTYDDDHLTNKNLDRLADFLHKELTAPSLATEIPTGAHLFHGSYKDVALTQGNLELASNLLLGMTLGYVDDAPLIMLFEQENGEQFLLDLSATISPKQATAFINQFHQQTQQRVAAKLNQTLAI